MGKQGVYEAFRSQLYEYLKTYTGGDVHTMVLTNGVDQSFETWRRLCDQGRSLRERPMRDEKWALYHPKQATLDTVIKAIADWEKRMADYVAARPDERHMEDDEKIMCLEDICPEVIQKYLSEKRHLKLVVKYVDYKDAIDQYFYEVVDRSCTPSKTKAETVTTQAMTSAVLATSHSWQRWRRWTAHGQVRSSARSTRS